MRNPRRLVSLGAASVLTLGLAATLPSQPAGAAPDVAGAAAAAPKPDPVTAGTGSSLGGGLGSLAATAGKKKSASGPSGFTSDAASLAIRDDQGRVLVNVTPRAGVALGAYRKQVTKRGLDVTAVDEATSTLEGYVDLGDADALAGLPRTGTLGMVPKPHTNVGATTSQGVTFQRANKVLANGTDGDGITVGVLSDSYDTAVNDVFGDPLTVHAAQDIASGDLPGPGNAKYPDPVVVLQDYDDPSATDEGRAMLQIVHDMAPGAKLCFATAFAGEVQFADNIRALADKSGPCKADVIVDDVGYFDEPFFSDGVVAQAVDDVAADGVSYFSSAGNSGDHQSWSSRVHTVKAGPAAKKAGLDLSAVDPALYAGGLQDMNPGKGVDVAQDLALDPDIGMSVDLQWDDPLDADGAEIGDSIFHQDGALTTPTDEQSFDFTPTDDQLGQQVLTVVDGVPSGSTDVIIEVTFPDGSSTGPIDTVTSPETAGFTLDQAGTYTVTVTGYNGSTGPFTVDVYPIIAPSTTTTDFNLLFFGPDGTFYGALGEDNTLTGHPAEIIPIGGVPDVQLVIAKKTAEKTPVRYLSYELINEGYVGEYWRPLAAPSTHGHPAAKGASGVAAYDPFGPYMPEDYTSQGGRLPFFEFDDEGKKVKREFRMKPDMAATDRGNTTFFVADDTRDTDDYPNFGGTSAAAPHAAAIAALMLDAAGGPGSLSPKTVRTRMQRTAFKHDLDPFASHGKSHGLTIRANGSGSDERNLVPGALADRHFFTVNYRGRVPLKKITLYGRTASPTARGNNTTDKGRSDGIVFDKRPLAERGSYREGGFPFTVGMSHKIKFKTIKARYSGKSGGPGHFRNLTIVFKNNLHRGQSFTFGVDRDLRFSGFDPEAVEGNGADQLGGATFVPNGRTKPEGMLFRAFQVNKRGFTGHFRNKLGRGWSPVDGWGIVDAEAAVR